jgi:hypothetical protein
MSTLTHLSDAELDAVTGGRGFSLRISDVNIALVSQVAANVNDSYKSGVEQNLFQNVSIHQSN